METTKLDTIRLKDGSEYPLSASWNDLTDKPFHTEVTETVLMPETELTFAYQKVANMYQYTNNDVTDIAEKWAGAWNKAIVVIDGTRYIAKKRVFQGVMTYIGDYHRVEMGMPTTGEPFVAALNGGAFGVSVFADTTPEDPDNVPDVTHTVSITLVNETVKKLEDAYQHQPDWNETSKSSAACIKNRPFGIMAEDGAVWAEKDVVWSTDDGAHIFNIDVAPLLCAGKILLEVDGTKYVSTEMHSEDGAIGVSFADADGNSAYDGQAGTEEATGLADMFAFYPSDESSLTDGQTIHVKVTVFGSRKQIDKDYLPILDKQSEAVLDFLVKFSYATESGIWASPGIAVTQELWTRVKNNRSTAEVVVHSDKYISTESSVSPDGNIYEAYTGGQFSVSVGKKTVDGVDVYILEIGLFGDAPEDTSTTQTHYINLRFQGDEDTYTIKQEYLPGLPEFDLTAMGLAAIPADGTAVSVECDTTELRSALDKGNVKIALSYQDGADRTLPITTIVSAMKITGLYLLSFVGVLHLTPVMFNIAVTDTAIQAQITTLAVPAASADAGSTGVTS